MKRRLYTWVLALLLPAIAVQVALSTPIEEHGFDVAGFHIYRGVVFSQARADGWFYPRWADSINAGLGGPLFNFYSPLAYYFMDAVHTFGIPHTIGWRLLIAASLIVSSLGMVLLGMLLFKRADIALVAAACFTYAPYLLRDLVGRGSPQGVGIALCPRECGALLVAFDVRRCVCGAGDASLALSTRDPSLQPVSYPVQLSDLLASPPIFDVGIDNNATGYSIGLLHILAIIIGAFAVVALWRSNHRAEAALVGLLCAFALLMIWMQTESATFVWEA